MNICILEDTALARIELSAFLRLAAGCCFINTFIHSNQMKKVPIYPHYDNSDYLELKPLTWENKWILYPLKAVIYLLSLLLTSALSSSWRWKHLPLKKLGKCGKGMLVVSGHSSSLSTSVSSSYGLAVLTLPVQILDSSTLFYEPFLSNRIYIYI